MVRVAATDRAKSSRAGIGTCILLLAGCVAGEANDANGFSSWDSAGIQIARNDATLTDDAPLLRLEQDLRIGEVSGRAEEEFGGLLGLEVAPGGEIYAVDAVARVIRVFAADGQPLRSFGKPGAGPGEFMFEPLGIALSADTVIVHDRSRFYLFRVDGTHLHTTPQRVSGNGVLPVFARGTDAWLAGKVIFSPARSELERTTRDTFRIRPFDPLIGATGSPIIEVQSTLRRFFPDMGRSRQQWLGPRAGAAVRTNGEIYTVAGDSYEIAVHASDGRVIRKVRADVERVPLGDGVMEAALALEVERASSPELAFGIEQARELGAPAFKPVAGRVMVASDGSVLLEPRDLGSNDAWSSDPTKTWDLMDPDGRIAGRFESPARAWVKAFTGSHIYAIELDDFDVQYIVRYRIVRDGQ